MAVPAGVGVVVEGGVMATSTGVLQVAEDGQGETLAGLAIGAVGEGQAAEVSEFADGGVAVENLLEQEVGGDGRVEGAVAPRVADSAAGLADALIGQEVGEVGLKSGGIAA